MTKMRECYPEAEYPGVTAKLVDKHRMALTSEGVYHVKFGNEKAWMMSIDVGYKCRFTNATGHPVDKAHIVLLNFEDPK